MTSTLSEERRAFLQRRTARYGLVLAVIGLGFWALRIAVNVGVGMPDPVLGPTMLTHLVGALSMLVIYAINATGARSERFIRSTELVLLSASCLAYGHLTLGVPPVFRPDVTLLLIFGSAILTRSIYVPSDWRWTAALAFVMGLELIWVVYQLLSDLSEPFADAMHHGAVVAGYVEEGAARRGNPAIMMTTMVAMWWLAFSVIAASASRIIYGLRRAADEVRQLGQYTLLRKIGEGGVGMVYEASHAMLRRPTAVKLLKPANIDERSIARFEEEVRATAELQHPNTVTVFDYGRTPDGVFYYAMELVRGGTLTRLIETDGPMGPARAMSILHQMASGLAGAHAAGLIHRDVKPDNVLLTPVAGHGEVAKLVDFGLVRREATGPGITMEGSIVGTPQYLAPETIRGDGADARSDIYALGGVGFFLLTGEHVFNGKTIVEVCSMHLTTEPDAPSARLGKALPVGLDELIVHLLAKSPNDRPASALEVQAALEAIDGFGQWTPEDARRWWTELGPDVMAATGEAAGAASTKALAIDLGRRT